MKKINVEEKARVLNELRMSCDNKTFTREELVKNLKQLGFNSQVVGAMIPKLFTYEEVGKARLYSFPKTPIHKSLIRACYDRCNGYKSKTPSVEESVIATLQAAGYQVRKIVGFDMEKFKAENPNLYKKYLRYETV